MAAIQTTPCPKPERVEREAASGERPFSPEENLLYRTLSGVIRRVEAKRAAAESETERQAA